MNDAPTRAAAVYWSPYLVLALFHGSQVMRIDAPRCRRHGVDCHRLHQLLGDFVGRFLPEEVVIEARTARHLGLQLHGGLVRTMAIGEAKRTLLNKPRSTHRELYQHLLAADPSLAGFIRLKRDDRPSLARFWPTAKLLAVAIAWAAFGPPHGDPSLYS